MRGIRVGPAEEARAEEGFAPACIKGRDTRPIRESEIVQAVKGALLPVAGDVPEEGDPMPESLVTVPTEPLPEEPDPVYAAAEAGRGIAAMRITLKGGDSNRKHGVLTPFPSRQRNIR